MLHFKFHNIFTQKKEKKKKTVILKGRFKLAEDFSHYSMSHRHASLNDVSAYWRKKTWFWFFLFLSYLKMRLMMYYVYSICNFRVLTVKKFRNIFLFPGTSRKILTFFCLPKNFHFQTQKINLFFTCNFRVRLKFFNKRIANLFFLYT